MLQYSDITWVKMSFPLQCVSSFNAQQTSYNGNYMSTCLGYMPYAYLMFPVVKEIKSITMIQDSNSETNSRERS